MSKSNTFETSILKHILNNDAIANIGDGTGLPAAGTVGSVWVRLYTDAVTVDDATIGTECAYTGYVAKGVAVIRSTAGWTVSGSAATNAAIVEYVACSAGTETAKFFALWMDNTNTTEPYRLYWGQLTADLSISAGVQPKFAIGALTINEL